MRLWLVNHGLIARNQLQQIEQLALVFVDPLCLYIEQAGRVNLDPQARLYQSSQTLLVVALHEHEVTPQLEVCRKRFERTELAQIVPPTVTDGAVNQAGEFRVRLHQPAPRRDAVGDVVEFVRIKSRVVGKNRLHHQFGVQGRDTVDLVRGHNRKRSHVNAPVAAVIQQRNPIHHRLVTREPGSHLFQKMAVDLADDFQMTWQQGFEHAHWPGLQCLRHQGVVGIGQRLLGDAPGNIPLQLMLVQQQAHQFGRSERRMGVVEMDGVGATQLQQTAAFTQMTRQHVLQ